MVSYAILNAIYVMSRLAEMCSDAQKQIRMEKQLP